MPNRKRYDRPVKDRLQITFGRDYSSTSGVSIDYGADAPRAIIDGTIANQIAVEIESRTDKQIRGAVLDLICHQLPRKLLIVLPIHMTNEVRTVAMCKNILRKFLPSNSFRVVLFSQATFDEDVTRAAQELGWQPSP